MSGTIKQVSERNVTKYLCMEKPRTLAAQHESHQIETLESVTLISGCAKAQTQSLAKQMEAGRAAVRHQSSEAGQRPGSDCLLARCAVRESVNKPAASAASPDYVKFQAVIKSAASAVSRKPKSRGPSSRGAPRAPSSASQAAVWRCPGAWCPGFGLRGACASSPLDHGLENPPGTLR